MIRTPEKDEMCVVLKMTDVGFIQKILLRELTRENPDSIDAKRLEIILKDVTEQRQQEIRTRRRIDREMNEELNTGLGIAALFG